MRIASKTQWVHVISTALLTHYRIDPKRGSLLQGIVGKMVHDHWKPYFTLEDVITCFVQCTSLARIKGIDRIRRGKMGTRYVYST